MVGKIISSSKVLRRRYIISKYLLRISASFMQKVRCRSPVFILSVLDVGWDYKPATGGIGAASALSSFSPSSSLGSVLAEGSLCTECSFHLLFMHTVRNLHYIMISDHPQVFIPFRFTSWRSNNKIKQKIPRSLNTPSLQKKKLPIRGMSKSSPQKNWKRATGRQIIPSIYTYQGAYRP